jgi:hypothetical protein
MRGSDPVDTDNYHFTSDSALTGTVAKTASSVSIVGSSTLFTSELTVNQVITIPGTATEIGVVRTITDNTHLDLWQTMANSASGQTATRRSNYVAIPAGLGGKYLFTMYLGSGANPNAYNYCIARYGTGPTTSGQVVYTPAKNSSGATRTVWDGTNMLVMADGSYIQLRGTDSSSTTIEAGSASQPMISLSLLGL